MSAQILQTIDVTGASYSAALMGMIATTILLFIGSSWVKDMWKIPVTLCGVAALVGILSVFEARIIWLQESQVPLVYNYVGWIVSMPLQIVALFFFARMAGQVSVSLFWRLLVVSVLMVLFRYLGEAGFVHATLAFLISIVFWLYILGELFFGKLETAVSKNLNGSMRRGYFWLRLIVTIGWAIYPLTSFIVSFNGLVDDGGLSIAYNLAEFLNRMAFGLIVLSVAVTASMEAEND